MRSLPFVFLISAVLAIPLSLQSVLTSNGPVSTALFASLEEAARLVDITYCVGTTGILQPFQCLSRCDEFPSLTLVRDWNTGPLFSDSCGYAAVDHNPDNRRIIVAFRGTYSIASTIADLSALPQAYVPYQPPANDTLHVLDAQSCDQCTVHAGFLRSWQNTRSIVLSVLEDARLTYPGHEIHLLGHSLGGAVALLAGLELEHRGWKPILTTFGEPRVGNEAFAKFVDNHFDSERYRRVTHIDDPVPNLPPARLGYSSHANEIYIEKAALPPQQNDLKHCEGSSDMNCIASSDAAKLWNLFFAHRDYFWRLGVCFKSGLPWEWKEELTAQMEDL